MIESEYVVSPGAAWLLLGTQGGSVELGARKTLGDRDSQPRSTKSLPVPTRGCVLIKSRRAPEHSSVICCPSAILRLDVFVKVYLQAIPTVRVYMGTARMMLGHSSYSPESGRYCLVRQQVDGTSALCTRAWILPFPSGHDLQLCLQTSRGTS